MSFLSDNMRIQKIIFEYKLRHYWGWYGIMLQKAGFEKTFHAIFFFISAYTGPQTFYQHGQGAKIPNVLRFEIRP